MMESAFNYLLEKHNRRVKISRLGKNGVLKGFKINPSLTLDTTIDEGVAWIDGIRIQKDPLQFTFTADTETYLDIDSSGTLFISEWNIGDPAPTINPGNIRLGKVTTGPTSILTVNQISKPTHNLSISAMGVPITPSNYYRNLAAPADIIISGREFVLSKSFLDAVFYPAPERNDSIEDPELGTLNIIEVREMFSLGGQVIGYRIRTG